MGPEHRFGRREKSAAKKRNPFDTAIKLLAVRDRSEKEIRTALERRGFDDNDIAPVIERLKSSGLIDDAKFAKTRALSRMRSKLWGRAKIAAELNEKGVPREALQNAIEAVSDEAEENAAKEALLKWLRKNGIKAVSSKSDAARASRHLLSRGFSFYTAGKTLDSLKKEFAEEED